MCCILFNWNKLRPLLQVAKLSVYNLSNKLVFYSGMFVMSLTFDLQMFAKCQVSWMQRFFNYHSVQLRKNLRLS